MNTRASNIKRTLLVLLIFAAACVPLPPAAATPVALTLTPAISPSVTLLPTASASPTATATSTFAPTPFATPSSTLIALGQLSIPHATIQYYDVFGSTESELRAQLDAKGPVDPSGYKGDALTRWSYNWSWFGFGTDVCDLSTATVSYQIAVTLPHWNPPANAPPALVAKWVNYIHALVVHETGHVEFAAAQQSVILAAIQNATCATANAAAQAVLQRIRRHDIEYDAATNHGATQGARFP